MNHFEDDDQSVGATVTAEVVIIAPTGGSGGDLVEPNARYLTSQVSALIDGFPATGVFGRVYGSSQAFPPTSPSNPSGFDALASPYNKLPGTQDRQWCNSHLTLSPSGVVPVACSNSAPFPEFKLKVWAVRNAMFPAVLPLFFGVCGTPLPCSVATIGSALARNDGSDEYQQDEAQPGGCGQAMTTGAAADHSLGWTLESSLPELRYRYLNVNDLFFGNRLILPGGDPIRASLIEIHARRVRWSSKGVKVRNSLGNRKIAGTEWRFPGTFEHSVVVNQPGISYQMLLSQSRSRPQTLQVDPNQDIVVQVNDLLTGYEDNAGSFDVVVKVLA